MEGGAIPDKEDRGGDTAESWAREWGNHNCADMLASAVEKAVERRGRRTEELTQGRHCTAEENRAQARQTEGAYLIFVIFFTLTHFES